jgi:uncharacterized membrane protein
VPDGGILLKYVHILAAMLYVTGYVAGAVLQVWSGRATDWATRGTLMHAANVFSTRVLVPAFIAAAVLGLATAILMGYPILRGWVLYSLVIYAILLIVGVTYWSPLGKRIDAAIAATDETAFVTLRDRKATIYVSIADGMLLLLLIYLMVVKPA